jgi:glucose-6-phosphate dehydrogenase assembly protein OpcA
VWSAEGTAPGEIEAQLRDLVVQFHRHNTGYAPGRALNLVCIVDREWSGEIANRLQRVPRAHASRTIVCAHEPDRRTLDAVATIAADVGPRAGEFALLRETVVLSLGPEHLRQLERIVAPLVVTDVPTVVWAPHGHEDAVDRLLDLAQVVLLDSVDEPDVAAALERACALARRTDVVDLAWLRSTPWRERIASAFDPPNRRRELQALSAVRVHFRPGSETAALLLLGWLTARLGWRPASLTRHGEAMLGRVRGRKGDVDIALEPDEALPVPGLAGIVIESALGSRLTLDRGTGGLVASRREPPPPGVRHAEGHESRWTILGASRGEPGILGEGIRQALMRDAVYPEALRAARTLA